MSDESVKFDVLTLFPERFGEFLESSLFAKALEKGLLHVELHDLRRWSESSRGMIDDYPYGGGDGVILAPEPLGRALDSVMTPGDTRPVIYLTPQGAKFDQAKAHDLMNRGGAVLLSGRYGGVDERIIDLYVDEELSIGDYVLMGGELPAMVVMETVSRLIPEVLGNEDSSANDSFAQGLLEGPQYTRPQIYQGVAVPAVLLSGDHQAIARWRSEQAVERTQKRRPDLISEGFPERAIAKMKTNLLSKDRS